MSRTKRTQRKQKTPLLLCVEGKAEERFFNHLKGLVYKAPSLRDYVTIKIISAQGNVKRLLKVAEKESKNAQYSAIILIYDMDVVGEKGAQNKHITPTELKEKKRLIDGVCKEIVSEPCFETLLLKIFRNVIKPYNISHVVKKEFKKHFKVEAHCVEWEKEEGMTLIELRKKEEFSVFFNLLPEQEAA